MDVSDLAVTGGTKSNFDRLRFGTYLAPNVLPVYEAVTEEVGRRLGIETELIIENSYESCERDENEVCFVCSLPYVTFERRGLDLAVPVAAPVLEGDRYGGRPIYYSDVIVHRDSPFRSLMDLRGRFWAYNEPLSFWVRTHPVPPCAIGRDQRVLRRGRGGRVSPGGHPHGGPEGGRRLGDRFTGPGRRAPGPSGSRGAGTDGGVARPSTIQPVAVSRRVPREMRESIREVLLSMSETPALRKQLQAGLVERFVSVDARSYDDIRAMVDACEAAGFLELR
jgi:phosphonate transport system substrate-binding protein